MAQTTTNYGLYKPEATDTYNHLVYDNPNMDTIDAAMKNNSDHGVDNATCIKSGTIHSVTRTNTSCPVFKFTATGDWNTGDTMNVDGTPVSVFLPNGEALVNNAYVINTEVLATISGTRVTVYSNGINLPTINANEVVYDNTTSGLTATDVQAAIDEEDAIIDRITLDTFGSATTYNAPVTITASNDGYAFAVAAGTSPNIYSTITVRGSDDSFGGYMTGQTGQPILIYVRKGMKIEFNGGGTSPSYTFRFYPIQ